MPKIPKGRRVGQAAVNALRALLEEHDHIVQEISGQNDFGEDLYVTFADDGEITSDTIKVQVKGGDSWRRGNGYAVPVDHHSGTWADGNIPVYCVVYDPGTTKLHWANATQQLRRSGPFNPPRFIGVSPNAVLNDITMASFVAQARRYVGRYRGRQAVLTHLGEMSGVVRAGRSRAALRQRLRRRPHLLETPGGRAGDATAQCPRLGSVSGQPGVSDAIRDSASGGPQQRRFRARMERPRPADRGRPGAKPNRSHVVGFMLPLHWAGRRRA
ncbi:hypothetical protein SPURM210S_01721 [Streptomyces purpurascens]